MITADILEVPEGDKTAALEAMGRAVAPLMAKAWEDDRKFFGDKPFNLNAPAMAQLWLSGDLKIFVAYDERQEPVGYLSGVVYRPLQYEARVFAIQSWWAPTEDAKAVLFKTALDAMKFLGVPEAFAVLRDGESLPALPARWKEAGRQAQVRLVKE
jgi:hypothetical protein